MRRLASLVAVGVVFLIGCAPHATTPDDAVQAYYRYLQRDPARLLPLLTEDFHDRHGISMRALEGWMWGGYLYLDAVDRTEAIAALAPVDAPRGRDAWEFAWLQVMVERRLRAAAASIDTRISPAVVDADRAEVATRVLSPGSLGFVQTFSLLRDEGGHWRIDAIEQTGVLRDDSLVAFATYPHAKLIEPVKALARDGQRL